MGSFNTDMMTYKTMKRKGEFLTLFLVLAGAALITTTLFFSIKDPSITGYATFAGVCGDSIMANTELGANLTECTGNGIDISTSNVILDCQGNSIMGDGGAGDKGVSISSADNVTVVNCHILAFGRGIGMVGVTRNISIANNIIENSSQ